MRKDTRVRRTVAGRLFDVRLPAYVCARCGNVEPSPEAAAHAELEIAIHLAVEGPAVGEALRHIRRTLNLRAAALAELLEVTAETVSRWENNQRRIDRGLWIVLGSILLESLEEPPRTLLRLRALSADTKGGDVLVDVRKTRRGRKRISGIVLRSGVRQARN